MCTYSNVVPSRHTQMFPSVVVKMVPLRILDVFKNILKAFLIWTFEKNSTTFFQNKLWII